MDEKPVLSVILPCLNEEAGLEFCLPRIKSVLSRVNVPSEMIVIDNGSSDRSAEIALRSGARVVQEPVPGYGAACMKGLESARGEYCFIADADGSYDFEEIPKFLAALAGGWDFVIGNRFKGRIDPGAMPWSHRHIGNPVLSSVLRLFFNTKIHDTHCGMRAITQKAYQNLGLMTTGMEFASEMIVMALKKNLRIFEIPVNYHVRKGISKLKRISDGWRHLRFMLLYKPFFLFFVPGILMLSLGLISLPLFYFDAVSLPGIRFYYHPMFLSSLFIITGFQLVLFALFAKTYAITHLDDTPVLERFYRHMNIERASLVGLACIGLGGFVYLAIFVKWVGTNLGALNEVKNAILALTLMVLGIQTVFSAFMLSILGIKRK
ncbi:MAG TPA: glycosyltransferase family 2 protein [Candidatus Omnitrophota bacterium]|nr:glycosyltransferase family 2 protein [Candidatus Omnitrophota bacterium]HPS36300.1 glycosyltransferase family 2 protein [Candidatus Omnitrophota bacterium]